MLPPTLILFFLPLFYFLYTRARKASSRPYPLPPGPKKLPIVENLFHIPNGGFLWHDYTEMCRQFGEPTFIASVQYYTGRIARARSSDPGTESPNSAQT